MKDFDDLSGPQPLQSNNYIRHHFPMRRQPIIERSEYKYRDLTRCEILLLLNVRVCSEKDIEATCFGQ